MIVEGLVDGRPAIVYYLTENFYPAEQHEATCAKVVFRDKRGGVMFLTLDDENRSPLVVENKDALVVR